MRFNSKIKNVGLLFFGVSINGCLISETIKANNKWNNYLSGLPEDQLEKLKARDWYLCRHGRFFGSGWALGERYDLDFYNAKPASEKEKILVQYRWEKIRREVKF